MNLADIENFTTDELSTEKIDALIKSKKSFQIVAIKDMSHVVNKLEGAIEKQNLKCRVLTSYRGAVAGAAGVGGVATAGAIAGVGAAAGTAIIAFPAIALASVALAAHRLATYDPDYEIEKNLFQKNVKVLYKRDIMKEEAETK
ncbi:hypothetical protein [Sulfurimonas sp.]|uniref:hypothetical protein n=1 Tax=Sulfurimonas sp. TaxID=2022749 RepID=UPI0025F2A950|nr:hypothetical protein [Sulfurimonas sp.]MDD5157244.1 hypothetical protein [Sulfurimonas sp.]